MSNRLTNDTTPRQPDAVNEYSVHRDDSCRLSEFDTDATGGNIPN